MSASQITPELYDVQRIATATALLDRDGNVLSCNGAFELLVLGKEGRSSAFFSLASFGAAAAAALGEALAGRFAEATAFIEHKGHLEDWRIVFIPQSAEHVLLIFVGAKDDNAYQDDLTGLPSRTMALDRLAHELDRWNRAKTQPFGIALADIDHFKNINDSYGHDIGDQVLKQITATFTNALRKGDWVARWGGEEFLFLFHDVANNALEAAERCRREVELNPFVNAEGLRIDVTMSFGVVNIADEEAHSLGRPSIEAMIDNADTLLYDAKHTGRNRSVSRDSAEKLTWTAEELQAQLKKKTFAPLRYPLVDPAGATCGSLWKPHLAKMGPRAAQHLFKSATRTNMIGQAESAWIAAVLAASAQLPADQFNLITISPNLLRRVSDFPEVAAVFKEHERSGRKLMLTVKNEQPPLSPGLDLQALANQFGMDYYPWIGTQPVPASSLTGMNQPQSVLIDPLAPPEMPMLESLVKMLNVSKVRLIMTEKLHAKLANKPDAVLFIAAEPEPEPEPS